MSPIMKVAIIIVLVDTFFHIIIGVLVDTWLM